jgi:hypothetical protein
VASRSIDKEVEYVIDMEMMPGKLRTIAYKRPLLEMEKQVDGAPVKFEK